MGEHNWALLAKAKRVRDGGKAAFIKFIVAAGSQAGPNTQMFTSGTRLESLSERLRHLQGLEDRVPVVPLLEIGLTESGLLIAMEEVIPLNELIEQGKAHHLSTTVLRDLDPDASGNDWHHFDVCPKNIGLLPSGRCVLIDIESLYLEAEGTYNISAPAWKPFRAPRQLVDDVWSQLERGGRRIDRSIAARKLSYEVALAAAECVLGPIPYTGKNQNLDRNTIDDWVAGADAADPAVAFWKQELLAAIDTASFPPLQELRERLAFAIKSGVEPIAIPLAQGPSCGTESIQSVGATKSVDPLASDQSGWSKEWRLMQPMVHELRAGKLGGKQVIEYRQALQQVAAQYPTQIEVWNELLLVAISYEKDAALALSVVTEALLHIPGNDDLARMRNIVQMWARERQNGSN